MVVVGDDRQRLRSVETLNLETGQLQTLHASKAPHDLADIRYRGEASSRHEQGWHGSSDHFDASARHRPPDQTERGSTATADSAFRSGLRTPTSSPHGSASARSLLSPASAAEESLATAGTRPVGSASSRTRSMISRPMRSGSALIASPVPIGWASSGRATAGVWFSQPCCSVPSCSVPSSGQVGGHRGIARSARPDQIKGRYLCSLIVCRIAARMLRKRPTNRECDRSDG